MTDRAVTPLAAVVIGRNEGSRLKRCLASLLREVAAVVYVDSGSEDGSVEMAREMGADVVELDRSLPFSAARARNAGVQRVKALAPGIRHVQVVDGDCVVVSGWLSRAAAELEMHPRLAVVCGRRREEWPDAGIFHRICDMEWNTPVGEVDGCGGDALIRLAAFDDVGGYNPSVIAGEEPEMCLRMRKKGWIIRRLDCDMTLHDARMTRAGQWWRRMVRAGHAHAQSFALHSRKPWRLRGHEVRSELIWAVALPVVALSPAWMTNGLSLLVLLAYPVQWLRIRRRCIRRGDAPRHAGLFAAHLLAGKFPQAIGQAIYWWNRSRGGETGLIEYKASEATAAGEEARHAA